MRSVLAALAAALAAASPAAAQVCDCGPATVVVPGTAFVGQTRYRTETVLVPRTRYVRRVVYQPRTRLVPRRVLVETTDVVPVARFGTSPLAGVGYPAGYRYGATYVPPGTTFPCLLGTIGCDSSAVGPIDY